MLGIRYVASLKPFLNRTCFNASLSGKVFAGQCRLIEKGFRQGGPAGYGLRRMLIDEDGLTKGILKAGQHKSFQTDRVILVPGPDEEVQNVSWIYRAFIHDGMKESQIAVILNQRGIKTDFGRDWTRGTVHQILTNEKYIGNNVFNRTSNKLKKRHVENDPDMWVRAEGVFEAIINPSDFYTRNVMQSYWYQQLFPTRLDRRKTALEEFMTTKGGVRIATSVGGALTGRGGDFLIIDDPLKPTEAVSETQRNQVNSWYDGTLYTRLNDKVNGCIIIIMQRLHEDDLVGHVLEQEGWDVVSLMHPLLQVEPYDLLFTQGA